MAYDNELKGVLFKNDEKDGDTDPDYKGSATVDGTEYWLNAWINEAKESGAKYMRITYKAKETKRVEKEPTKAKGKNVDDLDDDIPF